MTKRTVILTGSTGGLGKYIAEDILHNFDYELICVYRNKLKFERLIDTKNAKCKSYMTSFDDNYKEIYNYISHETEELILIINAFSILPIKRVGAFLPNEISEMIDVNIKQIVCILNEVIYFANKNNITIRIINIDSGASDFPLQGWGNYCAAKSYVNALLSVIALENIKYRIVSFDPGVMDTEMQKTIREISPEIFNDVEKFIMYKIHGKLIHPHDVSKYIIHNYIENWHASQLREKIKQ